MERGKKTLICLFFLFDCLCARSIERFVVATVRETRKVLFTSPLWGELYLQDTLLLLRLISQSNSNSRVYIMLLEWPNENLLGYCRRVIGDAGVDQVFLGDFVCGFEWSAFGIVNVLYGDMTSE